MNYILVEGIMCVIYHSGRSGQLSKNELKDILQTIKTKPPESFSGGFVLIDWNFERLKGTKQERKLS